ncbi:hypothetical protein BIV57_06015 [Mangrovactinospora gilvigrisea]|uniref:DUF190 domain-containing protein n=1 Tax=Mangrovactinospora gilvigrisea TaxID=1428644 RepID=A0A1J7CFI3_9ACTN|nr:DUF190 domain-containing protein [Mangrovactinospora gilvigrisea]OIV38450.1 hypothetical protein BIV57_06015 [Mangrovactinospora gilvigrisea]
MRRSGAGLRVTVLVGEWDRFGRRPLHRALLERARDEGVGCAFVLHGIEGFGRSGRIHTARLLDLAEDLPIAVVLVDTEARIRSLLPRLAPLLAGRLATVERVELPPRTPRTP